MDCRQLANSHRSFAQDGLVNYKAISTHSVVSGNQTSSMTSCYPRSLSSLNRERSISTWWSYQAVVHFLYASELFVVFWSFFLLRTGLAYVGFSMEWHDRRLREQQQEKIFLAERADLTVQRSSETGYRTATRALQLEEKLVQRSRLDGKEQL